MGGGEKKMKKMEKKGLLFHFKYNNAQVKMTRVHSNTTERSADHRNYQERSFNKL